MFAAQLVRLCPEHLTTRSMKRGAMSTSNVDHAWAAWTTAAGETLLALSSPKVTLDMLPAGATLPVAQPHLPRGNIPGGPRAPPRRSSLVGAASACSACPAAQGLVGSGDTPVPRLRALGPAYAGLELGGTQDRLTPLGPLCRLRTTLKGIVRATLRAEDKERLRE